MAKALKINTRDNVAVLMADVGAGETVEVVTDTGTLRLQARQAIGFGHKIALGNLPVHQPIIKYAQAAIAAGDWIHLHNVYCRRGHETV